MSSKPFISRFSPQRTSPEILEKTLVQCGPLLQESVERISESVLTESKHHLLFIGPRGAGKTHLVTLIQHRLNGMADLADKMRIAWLNEDETATSFLKLLILIYRALSKRYPDDFPLNDIASIYGQKPDIARQQLGSILLQRLARRTLVVITENLDVIFKDMPVEEQRTWRAFIQNHPIIATVSTAQWLFKGVSDRTEPFFGFFDIRHLDSLSVDEAISLLQKLATLNDDPQLSRFLGTKAGRARVQAIQALAGGNPRLYLIMSAFLTADLLDNLVTVFEEIADTQFTTYYQERLRWLSAQQREIVQYLCHQSQPVPVKQITEALFANHQTISNQLKILREQKYVRGSDRGREVLYEVSEPLMRLTLEMKATNHADTLPLVVDFLRAWYAKGETVGAMTLYRETDAQPTSDDSQQLMETPHGGIEPRSWLDRSPHNVSGPYDAIQKIFHSGIQHGWKDMAMGAIHPLVHSVGVHAFGAALLMTLTDLAKSPLNHAAYVAWIVAWETSASVLPDEDRRKLTFYLRILRVGVSYLQSQDASVLLSLPMEQRAVLRQALHLEPEEV
jgi:DNA-binding transcriptional ArsR family regulator